MKTWRLFGSVVVAATVAALSAQCGDESGPCSGVACSDHGRCFTQGAERFCECDRPEWGAGPDLTCVLCPPSTPCSCMSCNGHGTCVVVGEEGFCNCDPGYHEFRGNCLPDTATDADVGDVAPEDVGGEVRDEAGEGRDEAGEVRDEAGDEGGDEGGEVGPVCGNGVVEPGESCERGDTTGCTNCGHRNCRSDCSGYDSCTGMGICNPGDVWPTGNCGTMTCWEDCTFPFADIHCDPPGPCSISQSSICGSCGGDPCYRTCPGTQDCSYKGSTLGCTWDACVPTGGACSAWVC